MLKSMRAITQLQSSDIRFAVQLGQDGYGGNTNGTGVLLYLLWDRDLSDEEIAAISANPWQVFSQPSFPPLIK